MKKNLLFAVSALLLTACSGNKGDSSKAADLTIEMDTIFCSKLLPYTGGNVTGADGAISIDLKDGRSMFMWGDSFFGDVVDGVRQEPIAFMMGNVFTVIDQDYKIKNYYKGTSQEPRSYIEPEPQGKDASWYWPGHGFVRDGVLYLFMSQFHKHGEGVFAFEYDKCDYFTLDAKTLEVLTKTNFPAANINGVHYGHAVLDEGDYVYIYGTLSDNSAMTAEVHAARCKLENKELKYFEYWNGKEWNPDPKKTAKLEGTNHPVAEQFNVVKLKDKYILVAQDRYTMKNIYSYISDSPTGPFRNEKLILTVDEPNYESDQMMTYNTMVHPQYIKDGKVLMCYNVNTYDLEKVFTKASLYRPRFFWVPIDLMIEE
jgi:hypothetical protein